MRFSSCLRRWSIYSGSTSFARPKIIELLGPYGAYLQYIIPHPETETLAKSMADKGVVFLELAFDPQEIFKELEKREIFVHYSVSSR